MPQEPIWKNMSILPSKDWLVREWTGVDGKKNYDLRHNTKGIGKPQDFGVFGDVNEMVRFAEDQEYQWDYEANRGQWDSEYDRELN